ncbi:heparan-alpha-glucosaminide N-acetyltransferase domain-containing protein [Thalassotalea sp. 1_MG-2023]|uniref:acyltransferase family protein n=1 Tax=Thalassotalea sp. 1_MG-2023 TaxID=3062680 RepID=UPI0026E18812|nr:heparan-alpha-glucosaminide N-acetyltransferase domain-containing protein [Thalassotalea sp. 1_MG-2023]MDO6425538.1 heparan-alpha-glucosaminide N-acetyltransferase domain-containing protein [Thalassotalea sp. 1_MG-2023]
MQRYIALDAFRGLTIALMILVNTPGSWSHVYAPLLHAKWHGLTPTDLVFPFFMFIVGSAMFFAFKKQNFQLDAPLAFKVIKRGFLIFLIGFLLNIYPFTADPDTWRVMGVLQRIGIAYIFAAFIVLLFKQRGVLVTSVVILIGYHFLLMTVGEGAYALETNLVRQVDVALLGANHIYGGFGVPFDPEGLVSTIPAIVSALFGFEVTRIISQVTDKRESMIKLIQLGAIGVLAGLALDFIIPINKALWTSSYVIYTAGYACLTLAIFVYLIDIKKLEKPMKPLLVYGTNPLFIYVLSWVWVASYVFFPVGEGNVHHFMFNSLSAIFPAKFASFLFAFLHVVFFWWCSKWLYERKIFIKI